jgi:hypothetical protein
MKGVGQGWEFKVKGIYTSGRMCSDKYAAPRFSTFPLNSTPRMKIQPRGFNRKGISLAPKRCKYLLY